MNNTQPTTKDYTSKNHLNFREKLILRKELGKVLIKLGDGMVKYADEWDDAIMAKHMAEKLGRDVSYYNVVRMRQNEYGKVNKTPVRSPKQPAPAAPSAALLEAVSNAAVTLEEVRCQLVAMAQLAQDMAAEVALQRDALTSKTGEK